MEGGVGGRPVEQREDGEAGRFRLQSGVTGSSTGTGSPENRIGGPFYERDGYGQARDEPFGLTWKNAGVAGGGLGVAEEKTNPLPPRSPGSHWMRVSDLPKAVTGNISCRASRQLIVKEVNIGIHLPWH
jgi:hypothetical protein